MKTHRKIYFYIICLFCLLAYSCEEYLDKAEEADLTDDMIFSTFPAFQGFIEHLYYDVVIIPRTGDEPREFNWGDDILMSRNKILHEGQYMTIASGTTNGPWCWPFDNYERGWRSSATAYHRKGFWNNGWAAIRDANIAIEKLDLFKGTAEQKNFLEGQAYFWRAYFHWTIMKQWGGIPYIEEVISPSSDMKIPQLSFMEAAEKVQADFQRAADLLPVDWDLTETGQPTLGTNRGRLTKGMALSFLTQVQMWCASPLINGVTTGNYTYDIAYAKKAAASAWKVLELANIGVYTLEPWSNYEGIFKSNDGREPARVKEIIFKPLWERRHARWFVIQFTLSHIGGSGRYSAPSQNLVELFEMANGLPITDPESGFDPMDPWTGRDPRFDYNILKDRDKIIVKVEDATAFAQFYTGGRDRSTGNSPSGFGWKKWTYTDWNSVDNKWGSSGLFELAELRLAEIYLYYAEAVNEAYGPNGKDPNANITAIDAVNIIRTRAGMPDVHSKFTGSKEIFRERIRNERSIEFCGESKRRDDLRRWYLAHESKYKGLYSCEFDKEHTYFEKRFIKSIIFDLKHYWFPFPVNQVALYEGWKQNPGW